MDYSMGQHEIRAFSHDETHSIGPEHTAIVYMLQDLYDSAAAEPLPPSLRRLLDRLRLVHAVEGHG